MTAATTTATTPNRVTILLTAPTTALLMAIPTTRTRIIRAHHLLMDIMAHHLRTATTEDPRHRRITIQIMASLLPHRLIMPMALTKEKEGTPPLLLRPMVTMDIMTMVMAAMAPSIITTLCPRRGKSLAPNPLQEMPPRARSRTKLMGILPLRELRSRWITVTQELVDIITILVSILLHLLWTASTTKGDTASTILRSSRTLRMRRLCTN